MALLGFIDRLFSKRSDTPVVPPPDFVMGGPAVDAPEEVLETPALKDIDGLALAIDYEDPAGALSRRVILCRAVNPNPPGFVRAYCHLRHAYRAFRIDRIRAVTDMAKGDVLTGPDIVEFLAPYVDFSIEEEKAKAQRRLQYRAGPGVKVLVFLAAADGHVHAREQTVILDYAVTESARLSPERPFDTEATIRWINHVKPTRFAAHAAALKLAEDPDRFKRFAGTMMALVRADGVLHETEADAVRDIIAAVRSRRGL